MYLFLVILILITGFNARTCDIKNVTPENAIMATLLEIPIYYYDIKSLGISNRFFYKLLDKDSEFFLVLLNLNRLRLIQTGNAEGLYLENSILDSKDLQNTP